MRLLAILVLVLGLAGSAWAADGWITDGHGRSTYYHVEPNGAFYTIAPGGRLDQQGFVQDGNVYLYNTDGYPRDDAEEPDPSEFDDPDMDIDIDW